MRFLFCLWQLWRSRDEGPVSGSRSVYNRVEFGRIRWTFRGLEASSKDWLDALDEFKHLAKVRVAGSNPVFRSKELPVQLAGLENRSIDGVLAGIGTEQ